MKRGVLFAIFAVASVINVPAHSSDIHRYYPKKYRLKTCLVSDKELRTVVKPYVFNDHGQLVKLCREECLTEFSKDPRRFRAKLKGKK